MFQALKKALQSKENSPQASKVYSQSAGEQRVLKGLQGITMQTSSRSTFPEQVKDLEKKDSGIYNLRSDEKKSQKKSKNYINTNTIVNGSKDG